MPRYDYQCTSCGHQFELLQSFQEAGSGTCPSCSGEGRRHFHAVPIIFKGSGFYTTDYGRPKTPPVESKEKEPKKVEAAKTTGNNGSSSGSDAKSSLAAKTPSEAVK